jgi:hypothetical protein
VEIAYGVQRGTDRLVARMTRPVLLEPSSSKVAPLITDEERSAYAALFGRLPFRGDAYYAECRLGSVRQLDLLVAFARSSPRRRRLAEALAGGGQAAEHPAWAAAARFVTRWMTPDDPVAQSVSTLWLEFDDVRRGSELAAPSLSACLIAGYGARYRPAEQANTVEHAERLRLVYGALAGEGAEERTTERLGTLTAALPEGAELIHLSLMTARSPAAAKVYGVAPRDALLPYLVANGWRGRAEAVTSLLERVVTREVCGNLVFFDLNLENMGDPESATLGLAFSQQQGLEIGDDPGRKGLLAALARSGELAADRQAQLAAWTSRQPSPQLEQSGEARRFLDLKLVLDAAGRWETKAYLGYAFPTGPFARPS